MTETLHAAEDDAGPLPRASSNIRHLCRMEIPGGGQICIQGDYAYVGYQTGPEGTSILDISDPRKPKILSTINPAHPWSHSHKVRVTGDIMVVNSEIQPRAGPLAQYPDGGFRIYDVKDKTNPKLVTFVKTHGRGCHRFDLDENYAYMSTEMEGFVGNILVIYSIRDPAKPIEVGRWWMPQQNVAAGETPHPRGKDHRLHHAMRSGDKMFAGFWHSGVAIVDVGDIRKPLTLGACQYDPPCTEPTHTFLAVPFAIGGKRIAVSTEEERAHRGPDAGKPHAPFRTWDVTNPMKPTLLASYYLPETATPYRGDNVRFGTHQLREQIDKDGLCFVTWFAGGLRVMDIGDPMNPKERGYFIPKPGDGQVAPLTNDVAKDARGLYWITDKARGLDVIEFRG